MKIIIHGGFFSESSTNHDIKVAKQTALERILKNSFEYLHHHNAVDTVVYAVSQLEDDPLFNAGTGSMIQSDGQIRMSAALMDSTTLRMSGVINVQDVQNPIQIAQKLQSFDDRILGGNGATSFAHQHGFPTYNPETEERKAEYETKINASRLGTVGCVVLDADGHLAVGTSTGGKGFEIPGRISDSATVAGNYANSFCAVSLTGVGEDIVSGAIAAKIVTRVTDGMSIKDAFEKTFDEMKPYEGFAGAIAIDNYGNIYHQDSFPTMVFASYDGVSISMFQ